MSRPDLDIVILGLSITSSWGNGHATTYRGLMRELDRRGHRVLFLERDVSWYAARRDLPEPPYGRTALYDSLEELKDRFAADVREADFVIVGSYVPEGIAVGRWVNEVAEGATAFYDIDTPVTLAKLEEGDCAYLEAALIPRYDLYLSFTGGPTLRRLEQELGAPRARPLYCSVDPSHYYPEDTDKTVDLGYMGTYSEDRQPPLERLLIEPARRWKEGRFWVAGPQYPDTIEWPSNIERTEHLPPAEHRYFYNSQRFTLNVTRADMTKAGYAPSVRLFEAAACATPIISDYWEGLETFFTPDEEILVSQSPEETLAYLQELPEEERCRLGECARKHVLAEHTNERRAEELEGFLLETVEHAAASPSLPDTLETSLSNPRTPTEEKVAELGPWFHNLHLPDGTQTAPDHPLEDFPAFKWKQLAPHLPEDMTGMRALDIGCNAGFYTFELARRGAAVTAIDVEERYLRQARWAAEQYGLTGRVTFRQMQIYDLARIDETYDVVLFLGVFYHLRYPLLALDLAVERTERLLAFQTMTAPESSSASSRRNGKPADRDTLLEPGAPKMAFIERRLAGDPTNWWVPNTAAVEAMLRSSGLQVVARPGHEMYLCRPDSSAVDQETLPYVRAQLQSALGRPR